VLFVLVLNRNTFSSLMHIKLSLETETTIKKNFESKFGLVVVNDMLS